MLEVKCIHTLRDKQGNHQAPSFDYECWIYQIVNQNGVVLIQMEITVTVRLGEKG